jgi:ribosomal-protein-alanine N-acetyltransferase
MLTTERLIIRPFQKSDYEDLYEYLSLPETYRFERGKPISLKEAKKFCDEFAGKTEPGFWAATLKDSKKLIGQVSFFTAGPEFLHTWEIGYIFNPAFQNKGYASEAVQAIIKYAFTELGAHRIIGHCSPDNIPSWKVLEKCGLRREGLFTKNFFLRNDASGNPIWLNSYVYAMLEEDFK